MRPPIYEPIHVAVIIVCHNGKQYLGDCLESIYASDDAGLERRLIIVDNGSKDGSSAWIRGHYPQAELIESPVNLGFAGGNNLGCEHALRQKPGPQYLVLLNQDTIVRGDWLTELVGAIHGRPVIGCAQAKIMLCPATDRFNTAGNVSHFLGFGFTTAYGEPDRGQHDLARRISFASGAAMIVRASALDGARLFDPGFFAYLEDAELSWKLRQKGYDALYVPTSVVYHKYQFARDHRNYYLLERNRWWLLGTYYKTATLLLLLPALALMEAGQLFFAWRHGVTKAKVRAWGYYLHRKNVWRLLIARKEARRGRRVGDRKFLSSAVGKVDFAEIDSALLRRVANPVFAAYWSIARRLIFW